jgi:membrane-associated phospholipid phosphatase
MSIPSKNSRLLFVGFLLFIAFAVVTALVFSRLTQSFDASLAETINSYQGPGFTTLMTWASLYGREYFWIGLVFLMLVFGNKNTKLMAVELAALLVVGIIAGEIAKGVAFRERPYASLGSLITLRLSADTDSSFPSGHALIVSIGAIFGLIKFRSSWKGRLVAAVLVIEAAIVCYSRVYVGLHYPLDVLGGILLGGGIVCIGVFVIEKYLPRIFLRVTSLFDAIFRKLRIPEIF